MYRITHSSPNCTYLPSYQDQMIVIFEMGNKWDRAYKPPTFNGQSWREGTQKSVGKPEHGIFRVLVNTLTSEELQEHCLQFDTLQDFQRYLDFFGWREREDCIVNAKYLNFEQGRELCGTSFRARVYVEHIPVRLSDIQDIPYPENLYVLLSSLEGFQKLQQVAGCFTVTEDLICMDKDGRVKAWLNSDLSRCFPVGQEQKTDNKEDSLSKPSKSSKENRQEQRMVEEIIRLIEENTTQDIGVGMTVTNFIRLNHRGKGLTFKQAKQEIINYAERYQAEIPNYFESVIGIFDEKHSENDSLTEPHFNQQHLTREGYEQQGESGFASSYQQKITNAVHNQTLNRIPSYEQMHRAEGQRPGSAIYSLSQHPAEPPLRCAPASYAPTGTVNRSSVKVCFNYEGSGLPAKVAAPIQPLPASVNNDSNTANIMKVRSASTLPNHSFSEVKVENTGPALTATSSLKDLLSNNKLIYSDSSTTYELDAELTQDMIKYLLF